MSKSVRLSAQDEKAEWKYQFDKKFKKSTYDTYERTLMCDLETCGEQQKELLRDILFCPDDATPAACVNLWTRYIDCLTTIAIADRKNQVMRVFNKVLQEEWLDVASNRNNSQYIDLHLKFAALNSDPRVASKHYHSMYKKEIGRKTSSFYESWSNTELACGSVSEAKRVLSLGLSEEAQPPHVLLSRLQELQMRPEEQSASASSGEQKSHEVSPSLSSASLKQPEVGVDTARRVTRGQSQVVHTSVAPSQPSALPSGFLDKSYDDGEVIFKVAD